MNDFKVKYQIAQIIRDYKPDLEQSIKLTSHQKGVFTNMRNCRTAAMGGFLMLCKNCGVIHHHFHSCRNRNCNLCGGMKREQWVMKQKNDMLPVSYLHMVFTLPHQLNPICLHHQKLLFPLLMHSAWKTIEQFAKDYRHLGAKVGAVMVLHTWGQNLAYHPHVHCLIPAGGVTKQGKWRNFKRKGKYFAPVKQMSKVFRGKFTDGLIKLHNQGLIKLEMPFNSAKKYLHPLI